MNLKRPGVVLVLTLSCPALVSYWSFLVTTHTGLGLDLVLVSVDLTKTLVAISGYLFWIVLDFTILIHLVNHLLEFFRRGVLAQHPHYLSELLSANTAIFSVLNENIKCCAELYKTQTQDLSSQLSFCVQYSFSVMNNLMKSQLECSGNIIMKF